MFLPRPIGYCVGFLRTTFHLPTLDVVIVAIVSVGMTFLGSTILFYYRLCLVLPLDHCLQYVRQQRYYMALTVFCSVEIEFAMFIYYLIVMRNDVDGCFEVSVKV